MSANTPANISLGEDPIAGAFGAGMAYFNASPEERKRIAANATTLQKDEWEQLQSTMMTEYRRTVRGIDHLMAAGLTRNISLATKVDLWQERSGITEAEVSMDGETRSEEDRITYDITGVPVPIVHKDFRISDRDLQTSRGMGNDLQTDTVAEGTYEVSETLDELLFNGWDPTVSDADGNQFTLYGYTSHPDRNEYSGSDWGTASNIADDFIGILDQLDENEREGPFDFYFAPPQWRELRSALDPNDQGNATLRSRLERDFGQEIGSIHRMPRLDDGEAVVVDLAPDVIELAVAEDVQLIEWQSGSGMTHQFKVLASMTPEIKSDRTGQSGIVHATGL